MKTCRKAITALLITYLLAGCSGIPVSQDYLPAADFSGLNSYRWSADILQMEKETKGNNPLMNSRIHAAVDRHLASRNYQLKTDGKTDFLVSYQVAIRQRLTSEGASSGVSIGFGSIRSFGAIGIGSGSNLRDEDEVSLIIDILNAADNSLLWRGTSQYFVRSQKDPDELTKLINARVEAILAQFPPSKKTAAK
jgi:hypothetical protein